MSQETRPFVQQKKIALITFGCSWVAGVGVCYEPGMPRSEFLQYGWDDEINSKFSFRGLLSKKYNFDNINHSLAGSSNQLQFYRLKNFFSANKVKQLFDEYDDVIVLHGITSTARNYMYVDEKKSAITFMYTGDDKWSKIMVKNFYNHDHEVECLDTEMTFLDEFYSAVGIKNLWVDTFNTHNYPRGSLRLIGRDSDERDLLTLMSKRVGLAESDCRYHASSWHVDTNRIEVLQKTGYVNPYSRHPTKKGHELIAEILDEHIKQVI